MKKSLLLLGTVLLLAVILTACGGKPEPTSTAAPTEPPAPTPVPVEVPNLAAWESSAHNAVDTEPFRHWDDATENPDGVPVACAKCHTSAGYQDFLGADGSAPDVVDAPVPAKDAQGIQCITCHNPVAANLNSVAFPGFETDKDGNPVPYVVTGFGDASRCLVCHQGRESKASVDAQIARFKVDDPDTVVAPIKDDQGKDVTFGFRNIHYFAAAATLYGTEVKGGYEYDGKLYDAKFDHVEGRNTCIGCHDPHTLKVKVEECATCHGDGVLAEGGLQNIREPQASAWDYDGDGNKEEGMYYEIQGLQEALLAQIQSYAKDTAGTAIVYAADAYPYFFVDTNANGTVDEGEAAFPNAYKAWTPRLLKAAYNYQVSVKDPGAFAHGNKYIVQLLYDSIEDLGGDVSKYTRNDAGHFAGNTEPFRHWDAEGEVPFGCVKCHTAGGLPEFVKNGGTTVVTSSGSTQTTGVGSMHPSNGFQCSTCHDEANWPNRYALASVTFPSGKTVSFGGQDADGKFVADDSNLCISCHQGRESTTSVNAALRGKDADTIDPKISFKNIHYFAAGATLFGNDVQGAYQYEGKEYLGQNTTHPLNKCKDCHDVHALQPKLEACAGCHGDTKPEDIRFNTDTTDWDGDGNVTEGVAGEIQTLSDALYAQIQAYASEKSTGIVYDAAAYPYFFADADGDGKADTGDKGPVAYNGNWTPKLLKAAFNYQYSQKDPGAFVHNPKYVIQFLIDSIQDLGGDVSKYTRPEVPAPAQ
jgi:hypothetical protein